MKTLVCHSGLTVFLAGVLLVAGACQQPATESESSGQTDTGLTASGQMQSGQQDSIRVELPSPAESAFYYEAEDVLFVSNFGSGGPATVDEDGFISRVDPETGEVIELEWIKGTLGAPKGMAVAGNVLYVADMDAIERFDLSNDGAALPPIPIDTSAVAFPNDVCASPDGTVYFTDSGFGKGSDALYRIENDAFTEVASGAEQLKGPNGCFVVDDGVLVLTFNANEILHVDSSGTVTVAATLPQGGLDGIEAAVNGEYLVTSWEAGAVFSVNLETGESRISVASTPSPADLAYDNTRGRVAVPLLQEEGPPFFVAIRSVGE